MKNYIWLFILLLTCSCGGGGDDPGDSPVMSKDFINVVQNAEIPGDGGTQQISISSNCSWTIFKGADWISVTPTSGNNNETISLTAPKNTTGKERKTTLTITGGKDISRTVTVTQAKATDSSNTQVPGADDNIPPS